MKNKLVIFDGTSLVADSYYKGLTEEVVNATTIDEKEDAYKTLLKSNSGKYINAVQGFFKTFLRVIDVQKPNHVVVVWGTSRKTNYRRLEIYEHYKNDKLDMDTPLKEQLNTVQNILDKLHVAQYSSDKFEALDLAGSLAFKFKDELDSCIVARNSNVLQLADICNIWLKTSKVQELADEFNIDLSGLPKGFISFDEQMVLNVKGLTPSQYIDYKALIGNSYVGIPGVKEIGEKTALPLIQEYGSIENIYYEISSMDKDELIFLNEVFRNELGITTNPIPKLLKYKNEAFISRDLVRIRTNIYEQEEHSLNELKWVIDKSLIVNQLKKYDLTPVKRISKKMLEKTPDLITLLQTYNKDILSPSADVYVGDSISCVKENCLEENDEIIYISETWKQIKNGTYLESKETKEETLDKDSLIEDEEVSMKKISVSNVNNTIGIIKENDEDNEEGIDDNEEVDGLSDYSNENERKKSEIKVEQEPVKENKGFSLLESLLLRKYRCNSCNTEFIIINQDVNCCPHCGFSYNNITVSENAVSKCKSNCSVKKTVENVAQYELEELKSDSNTLMAQISLI